MHLRYSPLTAAILAILASPSHADDATAPVLPTVTVNAEADAGARDYRPAVSTVGAKTAQDVRDIPQTVNVVNKALMQAQGATSLADALRNVPGITIGGAEGGQIGNNINLRGFTARTDIYLDGFRDRGQYYRDLFDIEQIEVLQGPSSMLFGRGSTGGVINQSTKQARLHDDFTMVSSTLGTDGRVRATLDNNTQLSSTSALRVNVFGQDLQTTRDVMENKDFGIATNLRLGIGTQTEASISTLFQHNNDMPDYGVQSLNGRPVSGTQDSFYGLGNDRTRQDVGMINARIEHKVDDSLSLRSLTQFNHYELNARETAAESLVTVNPLTGVVSTLSGTKFAGNAAGGITSSTVGSVNLPAGALYTPAYGSTASVNNLSVLLQSHDRNIVDNSLDQQLDFIKKFATGSIKHELVSGIELGHDSYNNQAYSRTGAGMPTGYVGTVSLQDPNYYYNPVTVASAGNKAQSSAYSMGAYLNDTISLNKQWKVVTGIRRDRFDANISNSISTAGATGTPANASSITYGTSLREGIIYQPNDDQSYYVAYGTSFNPILEQLTLTAGTQALPPTTTRSYEVGGKWNVLKDKITLAASAFNERQENAVTKDAASGLYMPAGTILIKGISLSAAGHITDKLQITGGYMHMDPEIVAAKDGTKGLTPANTPRNTFTLWSSYDITPAWEIGGGPNYVSQRYAAASAASPNKVVAPGYVRWDGTVAYHKAKYEIRANLLNLTNKYYYDALIPSDGGRAAPGIGRTGLMTVSYRF